MARSLNEQLQRIVWLLIASLLMGLAVAAPADLGDVKARFTDQKGRPLADVFVGLFSKSGASSLPILARTNSSGLVHLRGLAAGTYEILIRSSRFRKAFGRDVEVRPGETELVSVILQQVLGVEVADGENLDLDSLLRLSASDRRRLILRGHENAGIGDEGGDWSQGTGGRAVVSVTTNPGLGGDYLVFPSGAAGGAATNFAFENPLGMSGTSVLAGQLSSGEDSLWRLKNVVRYDLSDRHQVEVVIGYGRLSLNQPDLGMIDSPIHVGDSTELSQISGPLRSLTLGAADRWSFGESFFVGWGLEFNQIKAGSQHTFASPHLEAAYRPFEGTLFRVLTASKRSTYGNTLDLPGGDQVNLSDAFYISRIGDDFRVGRVRYNLVGLEQRLSPKDRIEAVVFDNQVEGSTAPFAVQPVDSEIAVFQLRDEQAGTNGYRLTYYRQLTPNLNAAFTYLRGNAVEIGRGQTINDFRLDGLEEVLRRGAYHSLSTQIDARFPVSGTSVTALVKFVPGGHPIPTLDSFSDRFQTANEGVNVFVRQILPLPQGLFDFLGLDFLTPERIEALLDIRNLTNEDLGVIETAAGAAVLIQNPRTVRGGISLRF